MSSLSTNASSEHAIEGVAEPAGPARSRRRKRSRSGPGAVFSRAGLAVCVALVGAAPLLGGGVHRATLVLLMVASAVGFGFYLVGSKLQGRILRMSDAIVLPLVFLIVPALQTIPVPLAVRRHLDPKGTELLVENALVAPATWPLSLDPPSTRANIGRAALALVTFVVAFHLASGQRRRHVIARVVAGVGIAAVVIGLGHRILGISRIYGLFNSMNRTLLTGPFVNANHTAEMLELSAFACLACSFLRATALNRVGWMVGGLLCAAGVAATLSRGGILALGAGALTFAIWSRSAKNESPRQQGRPLLAWVAVVGLVVATALALGAEGLVDRFRVEGTGGQFRLQLWRDSLRVIAAHPMGIGRGAFDRVFPVYRTLKTPLPVRFAFVENEPLQLLIDCGWLFFVLVALAAVFVGWLVIRKARRDKIEAALLAGVTAVVVQNFFDFGLETPGVLLPFIAILGTILGRAHEDSARVHVRTVPVAVVAGLGLVLGAASIAHASSDDFDALLKASPNDVSRRELLARAQRVHPIDYYYPLTFARLEPLKGGPGERSPRLHALNRALALCPGCEMTHVEVARNLWRMGLRSQALLEWRSATEIQPRLFPGLMREMFGAGARPEELASLASGDPQHMIEVARFLGSLGNFPAAMTVLDQADALGVSRSELLLARAKLQLDAGDVDAARISIAGVHAAGMRDTRLALLDAQLQVAAGGEAAADQALATLQLAAQQDPEDLALQQMRLDLVVRFGKWTIAERVLEDYKQALYHARGSAGEAHVASARIYSRLGRWNRALSDYRIALSERSGDVALWMEYGRAAESAGRNATAREAYAQAADLSPTNREIVQALKSLDERAARLRNNDTSPSLTAP
jgi:tetratricopeptide (TPR) repeat protein